MKNLPFIKGKIASEQDKISRQIEESLLKADEGRSYVTQLPKKGLSSVSMIINYRQQTYSGCGEFLFALYRYEVEFIPISQ